MINTYCSFLVYAFILTVGSAQAAYVTVNDRTRNDSIEKALNVNSKFDLSLDQNATNPLDYSDTKYFHASAEATTGVSGKDWYTFSTDKANVKAFFDIDFAKGDLWSWIDVYDASGIRIGFNGVGEMFDAGTEFPWDSFLNMTLADPGQYFVAVGQYASQSLIAGQGYTLHIGVDSRLSVGQQHNAVPVPASIWLFGSALMSLMVSLRKKVQLKRV